ncbi:MAG: hypothetical protein LLG06_03385 [Desulfobacteraceae bacterium]|nr:hypothetical protein [Desulfobacteraceae bacterium]
MDYSTLLKSHMETCRAAAEAILRVASAEWEGKTRDDLLRSLDEKTQALAGANELKRKAQLFQDVVWLEAVTAAFLTKSTLKRIETATTADEMAAMFFSLGHNLAAMQRLTLLGSDEFQSIMQSITGTKHSQEQWAGNNQSLKEAVQEASAYYERGGIRLHNEVARDLAGKYAVSENSLREAIKPIARAFGKVRGEKK